MSDHSTYMNYMDDDTIEVGCHYCHWVSTGFEDEERAQDAIDEHGADSYQLLGDE